MRRRPRVRPMIERWLGTSWTEVCLVVVSTIGVFVMVIAYVRISGLRSFSKMSSFDFATTIATGSIMASVAVSPSVTLANGLIGLGALFAVQYLIARLRQVASLGKVVDNRPVLLMDGDQFLHDNLRSTQVMVSDVKAKLREANVLDYSSVRAVVLETTGDISVLHGAGILDPDLLDGVRGADSSSTGPV